MLVRELMTEQAESIQRDQTLQDAAACMSSLDIGFLPVTDDGKKLVGAITDRDIVVRAVALGLNPTETKVQDFMTTQTLTCQADDAVDLACQRMKDKQVRRLIVTDNGTTPVGVLALGDIAAHRATGDEAGEVLQQVSEPATP